MILRALLLLPAALVSCAGEPEAPAVALMRAYGCATCHEIPGMARMDGIAGPPLVAYGDQAYVAGVLPNTPADLARFIADPQQVDPRSAMPDLGVTPEEAKTIALYLREETEP